GVVLLDFHAHSGCRTGPGRPPEFPPAGYGNGVAGPSHPLAGDGLVFSLVFKNSGPRAVCEDILMASSTSFSETLLEQFEVPLILGRVRRPIVLVGVRFLLLPRHLSRSQRLMHLLPWAFISVELGFALWFVVYFARTLWETQALETANSAMQFNLVLKR